MLADVTREGKEGEVFHPVVVVDELSLVRSVTVEIEEACELFFDTLHVVREGLFVKEVALLRFA